jgi:hypothetical protein
MSSSHVSHVTVFAASFRDGKAYEVVAKHVRGHGGCLRAPLPSGPWTSCTAGRRRVESTRSSTNSPGIIWAKLGELDFKEGSGARKLQLQITDSNESLSCLQQFARDDRALDLVRSLVDLGDLRVAVESLHLEAADIA